MSSFLFYFDKPLMSFIKKVNINIFVNVYCIGMYGAVFSTGAVNREYTFFKKSLRRKHLKNILEDLTSWKGDMCSRKLDNKGKIKTQSKDNKEMDKVQFYSN
jgi:hypothetical protein